MLKVTEMLTKYNHDKASGRKIKYIVIHWVGAASTAVNNGTYFQGGGQVVVADGEILEFLPLPVGGIVSDREPEEIAAHEKLIDQAARSLGSDLPDPMMYMFFLPITAIPDYAITDAGPVDYVALTTFDPILEVVEK